MSAICQPPTLSQLYEIWHDRGTYLGTTYATSHAKAVEKFAAIREIDPYSAQNLHARLSPKNQPFRHVS